MSQDGQFLHYIFPYQFLDSPEWESLQPSEEGVFQVTGSPAATPLWPHPHPHLAFVLVSSSAWFLPEVG